MGYEIYTFNVLTKDQSSNGIVKTLEFTFKEINDYIQCMNSINYYSINNINIHYIKDKVFNAQGFKISIKYNRRDSKKIKSEGWDNMLTQKYVDSH